MALYDVENFQLKENIQFKVQVDEIWTGVANHVLIRSKNIILMFNIQTKKIAFKFSK